MVTLPPSPKGPTVYVVTNTSAADAELQLIEAGIDGNLANTTAIWDERAALGVVMADAGYPCDIRTGDTKEGVGHEPDAAT